jgi:hypothetical protein
MPALIGERISPPEDGIIDRPSPDPGYPYPAVLCWDGCVIGPGLLVRKAGGLFDLPRP